MPLYLAAAIVYSHTHILVSAQMQQLQLIGSVKLSYAFQFFVLIYKQELGILHRIVIYCFFSDSGDSPYLTHKDTNMASCTFQL